MILGNLHDVGIGNPELLSDILDISQGYINQRLSTLAHFGPMTKVPCKVHQPFELGESIATRSWTPTSSERRLGVGQDARGTRSAMW